MISAIGGGMLDRVRGRGATLGAMLSAESTISICE